MNEQNQSMEDAIAEALAAVDSHGDTPRSEPVQAEAVAAANQDQVKAAPQQVVAEATQAANDGAKGADEAPKAESPAPSVGDDGSAKALEELKTRHMRLMADFDNYRKRVQREQALQRLYAAEAPIRDLLGVVDNIERALSVSVEDDAAGSLTEGVNMILNQMLSVLERHGVKAFESVGEPFDPERHEAVARQGHAVHQADLVCEQMQKGYMLHDRLLRAASVVVSAGKLDSASDSSSNAEVGPEAKS
jgi:molecular chaperone GrpE